MRYLPNEVEDEATMRHLESLDIRCNDCKKRPEEIPEYVNAGHESLLTPTAYVVFEEGTYNPDNGHFLCTEDFIARELAQGGHLVGENGRSWTAP